MPIFALDSVRNARIDGGTEILLEEMRREVASFPFGLGDLGGSADVLEVYDRSRPRLNVLISALRDLTGARGIDVGAGFGFLPVLLQRRGVHAIAADLDPTLCRFAAAHGVDVRQYRIGVGNSAPAGSPFDFVLFSEVLEHLKLPAARAVREVAGLLRPGGRLLLTTPNVARLAHIETLAAGENFLEPFDESIYPGEDPTNHIEHVREYSVREVVEAVEAAGFGVDRVEMTGWGEAGYDPLPNPFANEIMFVHAEL
jgi:2-polyprenyl-3-methyl-5-hydroxy-6-metoxy-1,4-benzoquinol methylase